MLGNEVSGNRNWTGVIRLVAVFNRALTPPQIQQNFDAGVGEKFFLMFSVSHLTNIAAELRRLRGFAVRQLLVPVPQAVLHQLGRHGATERASTSRGIRIGLNGAEAHVGQSYANLDKQISSAHTRAASRPGADGARRRGAAREGPGHRRVLLDVRRDRREHIQSPAARDAAAADAAGPAAASHDRRAHVRRDQRDDGDASPA